MKTTFLITYMLFCISLFSQNPFMDGIRASDVVEFKDGDTRFNGGGFKVSVTGNCHVKYEVNEIWNDKNTITNYIVQTDWNWQDIATIEFDTIKNILRLNGRYPMPRTQKNADTGESMNDPNNNTVNVYFKTKKMVLDASKWALDQSKSCGGKVMIIH